MTSGDPGLVLYGPPAVGKSTITMRLCELDAQFALLPVVKSGPGRAAGYTMVSTDEFARRADSGDFVFAWKRYNALYAISTSKLAEFIENGKIPIVHLGSVPAIQAVTAIPNVRWVVIQMWAGRAVCEERARERGGGPKDLAARLAVYDQTSKLDDTQVRLTLDTDKINEFEAARIIQAAVR